MIKLLPPPIQKLATPIKKIADGAREMRRMAISGGQWIAGISQNMGDPRPPVISDAIGFQDPIDEICEEPPPRLMRSMLYVVAGMFLAMLLLAAVLKVDIVVVGTGRLATETPPMMLQPLDRSIIREIKVKPGDQVAKGQILATLDPTFAQADLASLGAKQAALLAQIRRLESEMNGQPFVASPQPTIEELLQQSLYQQRQSQYASQFRVYEQEIERRRAAIRTTQGERAAYANQLEIAKEVEAMRAETLRKQSGSKLNFLEAQASRMRIEQAYQDAGNRLSELNHELQSKDAERQSFADQWRQQTMEQLSAARTESAIVAEGLSKATLVNDLVVVTAPEDGVVLDVAKRSVGSVVNGAEPLITLIRSNANMIAEIMISSADIGYAKAGDDVVVKVDAFPWQKHGLLKGTLLSVGEESFPMGMSSSTQPEAMVATNANRGGAAHRGLVRMTDTRLVNLPAGAKLIPGMTLSAEIKVGSRSVLSYFLNPITRGLSESIREP